HRWSSQDPGPGCRWQQAKPQRAEGEGPERHQQVQGPVRRCQGRPPEAVPHPHLCLQEREVPEDGRDPAGQAKQLSSFTPRLAYNSTAKRVVSLTVAVIRRTLNSLTCPSICVINLFLLPDRNCSTKPIDARRLLITGCLQFTNSWKHSPKIDVNYCVARCRRNGSHHICNERARKYANKVI
ncbi:hypothetical protein OESDEN_18065, partial [Oesophagostomum dentatum]